MRQAVTLSREGLDLFADKARFTQFLKSNRIGTIYLECSLCGCCVAYMKGVGIDFDKFWREAIYWGLTGLYDVDVRPRGANILHVYVISCNNCWHKLELSDKMKVLATWRRAPYSIKLSYTEELIRNIIDKAESEGKIAVIAFSGGKDSLVVLDIFRRIATRRRFRNWYVVYCNTTIDFPEHVMYVRDLAKRWSLRYIELKPSVPAWEVFRRCGFPPPEGRWGSRAKSPCCIVLKELPFKKFLEENTDIEYVLYGFHFDEATTRAVATVRTYFVRRTEFIGSVKLRREITKVEPIAFWTEGDVVRYVREHGLPLSPVYQRFGLSIRTGCVVCTANWTWIEKFLRLYNPKLYEFVKRKIKEWGWWEYGKRTCDVCSEAQA